MTDNRLQLEQSWSAVRDQVDEALADYVARLPDDCPARLRDAMGYSLLAGGKRLRPVLLLLACQSVSPPASEAGASTLALPAACAIEMVHTYSLVHDDLPAMDDDELRRGRPTNHVQFDEATAILAGDGLLTWAFEILADDLPAAAAVQCVRILSRAAGPQGMVGGQMVDLLAETDGIRSLSHLESIHRRKTGCLLTAALEMGAVIGAAGSDQRDALRAYGRSLGLAFQIADDVLDMVGEADKMGKGVRKDSAHGKLTYPDLLGLDESRQRARELVEEACERLNLLGDSGQNLRELARFVVERDH